MSDPTQRSVSVRIERFPIAGTFTIARGARTEIVVVTVAISECGRTGRGEGVPYARYGESPDSVVAQIEEMIPALRDGLGRLDLYSAMIAGAARNAVDCALWDLECKLSGLTAAQVAGITAPRRQITAYTLSLGSPESMAEAAAENRHRPLLKVKLGAEHDGDRIRAVRAAAPEARLIIDANEGWRSDNLAENIDHCIACRVELIEQPLPAGEDDALADRPDGILICADESLHTRAELPRLRPLYDAINIKLDKAGGLTEALALRAEAKAQGFRIMVGCMLGTSLAMAPALFVAQQVEFVDLDGPLLLTADRENPLSYDDGWVNLPSPLLWGA
jgi:L-alanine-DL-glutamate epimerase-like enolase superfamily enzyme